MIKLLKLAFVLLLISWHTITQEQNLKDRALDQFKKEQYEEAIKLLEKALEKNNDDPELYYYLGFFNHYRAYDSRPLAGYDFSYSKKIFEYLDKAIELKPDYGDAKYFYGAECSANAFNAMQDYELDSLKYFYKLAYKKGAYPKWLLEFGRNFLNSCEENAILFAGGNADFDVCTYLQLHENYRNDITIIPVGFISRPWYILFLKNGLEGGVKNIDINLSEKQIMDIHAYKWDTTTVSIPVSQENKNKYQLDNDFTMQWTVTPDFVSNRIHRKINQEKSKKRKYLSPRRAMLLQIIEDNYKQRPIYFSNFANHFFYAGLNSFFRNCGLTSELLPFKTKGTEFSYNYKKIQELLKDNNLRDYHTVKKQDIPRISGIALSGYGSSIVSLAQHYSNTENEQKLKQLIEFYKKHILLDFNKKYEEFYLDELEKLNN